MIEICESRSDILLPGKTPQGFDYIHSASRDENEDAALHLLSHVMIMPISHKFYGRNVNVGRDVRRGLHQNFRRGREIKIETPYRFRPFQMLVHLARSNMVQEKRQ